MRLLLLFVLTSAVSLHAQSARRALNGEWTGSLVLDNSRPDIAVVFEANDSTLAGRVYADGKLFGPMEGLSLADSVVHFKANGLDFTARVRGVVMAVDLIVYNGSHRDLKLTKTPDAPVKPQRDLRAPL